MGYFSRETMAWSEQLRERSDWNNPTEEAVLRCQMEELMTQMEELDDMRPRDPLHPMYDRYFYEDHLSRSYEMPDTVQGLLRAIESLRAEIQKREKAIAKRNRFLASVRNTGADEDGQFVLISALMPLMSPETVCA